MKQTLGRSAVSFYLSLHFLFVLLYISILLLSYFTFNRWVLQSWQVLRKASPEGGCATSHSPLSFGTHSVISSEQMIQTRYSSEGLLRRMSCLALHAMKLFYQWPSTQTRFGHFLFSLQEVLEQSSPGRKISLGAPTTCSQGRGSATGT